MAFVFSLKSRRVLQLHDAAQDRRAVECYFAPLTARQGHEFFVTTRGAKAHAI
jgi:hypothetical protein